MDKYIPTGFTEEEADFMDSVPEMLRTKSMLFAAAKYNDTFNTDLSTRQFHDRFDDYMKILANPEIDEEEPEDEYDPVGDFLNETKYSMAFRAILQEYEDWRMDQVEDEFQQYMQIYNKNMAKYSQIMDSIRGIFG